ncbi:MAG TPA: hypothetical protein VMI56_21880 [Reyranella sp.]|nr:hypothetical protein [Reyranella sp.]
MSKLLSVHSLIAYLTQEGTTRRQADWDAYKIIRTLKGKPFNGYFELSIGGKNKKFENSNASEFLPVLFRAVGKQLKAIVPGPFELVPIPNSSASVKSGGNSFATLKYAQAIAGVVGAQASVSPALLWKVPKTSARDGGSRDPQVHCANLAVVRKLTKPVVIFDDVMTSGSQMIAAHRMLRAAGAKILLGLAIGRTIHEPVKPVFKWREEEIETESRPIEFF